MDSHATRRARGHEVVEDLVGNGFVEDAAIPKPLHVVLERLQLDAQRRRDVSDVNLSEVRLPRDRAYRGELRTTDGDLELALRSRTGERLERDRA
jgi:hypothetical protein